MIEMGIAFCQYLSPKKYKWEGPNADFTPESDNLPWSLEPDHKITVQDIKYLMSSYYQGQNLIHMENMVICLNPGNIDL